MQWHEPTSKSSTNEDNESVNTNKTMVNGDTGRELQEITKFDGVMPGIVITTHLTTTPTHEIGNNDAKHETSNKVENGNKFNQEIENLDEYNDDASTAELVSQLESGDDIDEPSSINNRDIKLKPNEQHLSVMDPLLSPQGEMAKMSDLSDEDVPPDISISMLSNPINTLIKRPSTPTLQVSRITSPQGSIQSVLSPQSRRRMFDDRAQTRIGSLSSIRSPKNAPSFINELKSPVSSINEFSSINMSTAGTGSSTNLGLLNASSNGNLQPWDTMRWIKLRKISRQIYSETSTLLYGTPTCVLPSAFICIGTSKGFILIFDYHQSLKVILGKDTISVESGAVSALAVSADSLYLATGYDSGRILTWDFENSLKPILQINPITDASKIVTANKQGHLEGSKIHQLGFIGKRHSALVSADVKGMAFYHESSRTIIGRKTRTVRILGRYINIIEQPELQELSSKRPRKPTTVFACAPLPLGTAVQAMDSMGLVALMTPYILVIVSTNPTPRTQFKVGRPKNMIDSSGFTGCFAWLPALRPKSNETNAVGSSEEHPKLAYCWSNVLTILDVEESDVGNSEPTLSFTSKKRWVAPESIVSIQWSNTKILMLLTVAQQLIILNETTLQVAATVDLLPKHVLHFDFFSPQLHDLQLKPHSNSIEPHHLAIADCYFNCFRCFKGRLFLLGKYEFVSGVLSNWADRLLDIMTKGDYVTAINLALKYYRGVGDLAVVGLSQQDEIRHKVVHDNLLEMVVASLQYAMGHNKLTVNVTDDYNTSNNNNNYNIKNGDESDIARLLNACFEACIEIDAEGFLFQQIYELFENSGRKELFFNILESFVLEQRIQTLPPTVLSDLVTFYISIGKSDTLEELIVSIDITTLDIDMTLGICLKYHLTDTKCYIWNSIFQDYVTPFSDFINIIYRSNWAKNSKQNISIEEMENIYEADKIYSYLSFILTGRQYPKESLIEDPEIRFKAKTQLLYLLFDPHPKIYENNNKNKINGIEEQTSFPYLRLLLNFNSLEMFSTINEAFEDELMNEDQIQEINDVNNDTKQKGMIVSRQYITNILLDLVLEDSEILSEDDNINLSIFIARNYPKYPQFIILGDSTLRKLLLNLCQCSNDDRKEDRELSLLGLLTRYHPSDLESFIGLFKEAHFTQVLRQIYRTEKHYSELLKLMLAEDFSFKTQSAGGLLNGPFQEDLISNLMEAIKTSLIDTESDLYSQERRDVEKILIDKFQYLVELYPSAFARLFNQHNPSLHLQIFNIKDNKFVQYIYLKELQTILEEGSNKTHFIKDETPKNIHRTLILYIGLMCQYDPSSVYSFIKKQTLKTLKVDELLDPLRKARDLESIVFLYRSENRISDAMNEVVIFLETSETNMMNLLTTTTNDDVVTLDYKFSSIERSLWKYLDIGAELCTLDTFKEYKEEPKTINKGKRKGKGKGKGKSKQSENAITPLYPSENMWLRLMQHSVSILNKVTNLSKESITNLELRGKAHDMSKRFLQTTFTRLINSKSNIYTQNLDKSMKQLTEKTGYTVIKFTHSQTFLRIFSEFLNQSSIEKDGKTISATLGDIRTVLNEIFLAYSYESHMLNITLKLVNEDIYRDLVLLTSERVRGWRVNSSECEACGKKVLGKGVEESVFCAWEDKKRSAIHLLLNEDGGQGQGQDQDSKSVNSKATSNSSSTISARDLNGSQLVLFKCNHIYHLQCLRNLGQRDNFLCIVCSVNN